MGEEDKVVVGLSWNPKLPPSFASSSKPQTSEIAGPTSLYKSNSELIDGLYVPPNDPKKLNRLVKKQVKDTSGKNWFDMPAPTLTPELKKDLQLLKLRGALDPKRHYKKGDGKALPKYFQVGTVIESPFEYHTGRLTKKERKASFVDELMADPALHAYRKRKVREIEEVNKPTGVSKWKIKKGRMGKGKRK